MSEQVKIVNEALRLLGTMEQADASSMVDMDAMKKAWSNVMERMINPPLISGWDMAAGEEMTATEVLQRQKEKEALLGQSTNTIRWFTFNRGELSPEIYGRSPAAMSLTTLRKAKRMWGMDTQMDVYIGTDVSEPEFEQLPVLRLDPGEYITIICDSCATEAMTDATIMSNAIGAIKTLGWVSERWRGKDYHYCGGKCRKRHAKTREKCQS